MTDDPLYGDRPKPPLVPMNNSEVILFDTIRGLDGASTARRSLVLGGVAVALALVGVLSLYATSTSSAAGVRVRAHTPQQALSYLCSQYRSAETSYSRASAGETYATGEKTRAAFEHKLAALANPVVAFHSSSIVRFTRDVSAIGEQLSTDGDIGGPSTSDLHGLCAE